MTERWLEIETLYHSACERTPDERRAFLEGACGGDEALRREVESLLANDDLAATFLEGTTGESEGSDLEQVERVPPGQTIGPYVVQEFLRAGGMGEVYQAHDTRLNRTVAVKFLPQAAAADPAALERFQREAHAASALNHPRICTIHDLGDYQGRPFIVMERLEGRSLRDRVAETPMPVPELLDLAVQICDALQAAHGKRHGAQTDRAHFDIATTQCSIFHGSRSISGRDRQIRVASLLGPGTDESGWESPRGEDVTLPLS